MSDLETVFIGIGSNLGDSVEHCRTACRHLYLTEGLTITARSPLYETDPYGKTDQPVFTNAVVCGETDLEPAHLLKRLQDIEKMMGRIRREKWGPRLIDLDLLFFGSRVLNEGGLKVPHPGIADRPFVLTPLCDLAPEWKHPVLNKTARQLLDELGKSQTVRRLESEL